MGYMGLVTTSLLRLCLNQQTGVTSLVQQERGKRLAHGGQVLLCELSSGGFPITCPSLVIATLRQPVKSSCLVTRLLSPRGHLHQQSARFGRAPSIVWIDQCRSSP